MTDHTEYVGRQGASAAALVKQAAQALQAIPVPEQDWKPLLAALSQPGTQDPEGKALDEADRIRYLSDLVQVLHDMEMYLGGEYLQKYCFTTAVNARTTPDRYTYEENGARLCMPTSLSEVLFVMSRLLKKGYRYEGTLSQFWNEALSGNMYMLLFSDRRLDQGAIPVFFRSLPVIHNSAGQKEYRAEADMYCAEAACRTHGVETAFWEAAEELMRRNGKRSVAQILEYHEPDSE